MLDIISNEEKDSTEVQLTASEFSMEVERRTWEDKDEDSYIYHTANYIEELNLDAEDAKRLISPPLMDKIRYEALMNHQLKEKPVKSLLDF